MSEMPTPNSFESEENNLIRANSLVKRFGFFKTITPVDGVSLQIKRGEIVALLGPNGAGKSTTFDMISGLTQPSSGSIELWDETQKKWIDITREPLYKRAQKGICYLPQKPSIFANLSVKDNLLGIMEMMKPEQLRRLPAAASCEDPREVREVLCWSLLKKFNLREQANSMAHSISGGEQRRLEIARAFIQRPRLILMDEPFAAVDLKGIRDCSDLFMDVCKQDKVSFLIIDHRLEAVLSISNRGYYISKSNDKDRGKVFFEGKPYELVRQTKMQNELLADRIKSFLEMFPMPEEEARRERELDEAERRVANLSELEKQQGIISPAVIAQTVSSPSAAAPGASTRTSGFPTETVPWNLRGNVSSQVSSPQQQTAQSQAQSQAQSPARSQAQPQVYPQVHSPVRPQVQPQVNSPVQPQVSSPQVNFPVQPQVSPQVQPQRPLQTPQPQVSSPQGSQQAAKQRELDRRERERQDAAMWQSEWLKTTVTNTMQTTPAQETPQQTSSTQNSNPTTRTESNDGSDAKPPFTYRTFRKRNPEERS